jgi:hypothetical protein
MTTDIRIRSDRLSVAECWRHAAGQRLVGFPLLLLGKAVGHLLLEIEQRPHDWSVSRGIYVPMTQAEVEALLRASAPP